MVAEQLDIFERPPHLQAMRSMRIFHSWDMSERLGMKLWDLEFRKLMREDVRPQALICRYYFTRRLPAQNGFEGIDEWFCYLGQTVDWHIELTTGRRNESPWIALAYPGHEPEWIEEPGAPIASASAEKRETAIEMLIQKMQEGQK
jgi:hypothetical protein